MEFSFIKHLFFLPLLFALTKGTEHMERFSKEDSTYAPVNGKFEIVVELAIVCDVDFSAVFQHDQQKLVSYWNSLLWDVHLRFLTLQNVSLSFRVNEIITLKSHEEESFLENAEYKDSKLLYEEIPDTFGKWLYKQASSKNFTNYDIAILATASQMTSNAVGVAYVGGACLVDNNLRRVESSLTISMKQTHIAATLTHEIGHLLGAPHDTEEEYAQNNCGPFISTEHEFVMAYDGNHTLREHFFSDCSQMSIQKVLRRKQADCLRRIESSELPLIDTSLGCGHETLSLDDQCRVIANDTRAVVLKEDNNCMQAKCHLSLGRGMFSVNRTFDILEGSECIKGENKGKCFRGSCITPGGLLVNVATGKCIGNKDASLINETASLTECLNGKLFSPLDFIRLEKLGSGGVLLKMLFSNIKHNSTEEKCLSIKEEDNSIIFVNCTVNQSELAWRFSQIENPSETDETDFLLLHPQTMKCVVISENSIGLEIALACNENDPFHHWKFLKESDVQKHVSCTGTLTARLASSAINVNSQSTEMHFIVLMLVSFYYRFTFNR